jgi:eukaryotic-like serine/threonine-protein kinase
VSRSGELAVITGAAPLGRLARVPLNGGAPRELLDHVIAADWSRDVAQLAIARVDNGKCRLEYPIGKPLYETIGWISHMRLSPQGDAIAFMDHPLLGDDRGHGSHRGFEGKQALAHQGMGWGTGIGMVA